METELYYKLTEPKGTEIEGTAKATLDEKYLVLMPEQGEPLICAYTDIVSSNDHDYQIDLQLINHQTLSLSRLGYQYEDFLFQFYKLRNELLLKYLLMDEKLLQTGFNAQYTYINSEGQPIQKGICEARLYETALLVLPQKNEPIRQPYSYLQQTIKQDYKITLTNEFGEKLEFSQLGEKLDFFTKALTDAISALARRTQETIKEIIPEADPLTISKLATLLKDGKAAKRKTLDALAPDFWKRLTKQIQQAGLTEEYKFLEANAQKENISVGVKRGLIGDLTGIYFWLLFPIRDGEQGRLKNAVAMEAFTANQAEDTPATASIANPNQEDTDAGSSTVGKATYFFKILNRNTYTKATDEEVAAALEIFLQNMNRYMTDINFRREPIYLTPDALENPKYAQYRYAIQKLHSLQTLRSQFIGRVIHSTFLKWQSDVTSLLNFNAYSQNDSEKWKRGQE